MTTGIPRDHDLTPEEYYRGMGVEYKLPSPIVSVDLEAMELAFNSITDGKPTDVYRVEASKMFNVPEDKVTPEQRRYAKQQMYLRIYRGKP